VAAPLVGILLAAGSGSRFRASGGGDKLMHPLPDGTPIAVAALRNLIAAVPRVVAVVRPGADALAAALRGAGAQVTVCPDADEGMGRTLSHAVRTAGDAGGYIVALADMPSIRPDTVRRVAACVDAGAAIAVPMFQGERGHPVGFARGLRDALEASAGDAGAREVIKAMKDQVRAVEVDDRFVVRDIDSMVDLAAHGTAPASSDETDAR
jgi:molybdenum cofactor cytidylyltransferase